MNRNVAAAPQKNAWSRMDQNEDAYFSTMEEDEDTVIVDTLEHPKENTDLPEKFARTSPSLVDYPDDDDDELLVRPKKDKPIKLSITIGDASAVKLTSTSEEGKGLVGEKKGFSEKRATSPPLEFIKSSLNSMEEAATLEKQQILKKQRKL